MNGDQLPDIITVNIGSPNGVIINKGAGKFSSEQHFGAELRSYAIEVADLDNDGDSDVVVANVMAKNEIYLNDGNGILVLNTSVGDPQARTYALAIGDVNKDGKLDIVTGSSGALNKVFYQKQGSHD